jgi:uncharacterized protein YkwD
MRTILISLFMVSVLNIFSQTNLDKLVFKKVNEYRKQKKLKELTWDDKAYKASDHHLKYMVKNSFVSHDESNDTPTSFLRLKKYGVNPIFSGENIRVIMYSKNNDELMAKEIVDGWKKSPKHNEIMLSDYKKSAVSCDKGVLKDGKDTYDCMYSNMVFYSE